MKPVLEVEIYDWHDGHMARICAGILLNDPEHKTHALTIYSPLEEGEDADSIELADIQSFIDKWEAVAEWNEMIFDIGKQLRGLIDELLEEAEKEKDEANH